LNVEAETAPVAEFRCYIAGVKREKEMLLLIKSARDIEDKSQAAAARALEVRNSTRALRAQAEVAKSNMKPKAKFAEPLLQGRWSRTRFFC